MRCIRISTQSHTYKKVKNDSTKVTFLYALEKWMHICPDKVVECWEYALNSPNPEIWPISRIIDKFSHWKIAGIEEVLEKLLKIEKEKQVIGG